MNGNGPKARVSAQGVLLMAIAATLGVSITLNGFLLRDAYTNLRDDVVANSKNIKGVSENVRETTETLREIARQHDLRITSLELRHELEQER